MAALNDTINGFLYALYITGSNATEAHSKLLSVTVTEKMTLEQVKEHFEKIKKREFTMDDKERFSENPKLHFNHVMAIASRHILAHCGIADRLTLRKVNHQCRYLVDNCAFTLNRLFLTIDEKQIGLTTEAFHVQFEAVGKHHVVTQSSKFLSPDKSSKLIQNEDFISAAKRDFATILKSPLLKIDHIAFYVSSNKERCPSLTENLFELVPIQLKTRKIKRISQKHLPIYLPTMDPNYLKVVETSGQPTDFGQPTNLMDLTQIAQMKQCKNLKELVTNWTFNSENFIENFSHFDYLDFVVENLNMVMMDEVEKLKDIFLRRPTLQKFKIIPFDRHTDTDPIFHNPPKSFLPFQDKSNPEWYYFDYPNHPESKLSVKICKTTVLFKGPCFEEHKIEIINRRGRRDQRQAERERMGML